jgi:hypothetical protein
MSWTIPTGTILGDGSCDENAWALGFIDPNAASECGKLFMPRVVTIPKKGGNHDIEYHLFFGMIKNDPQS